MCAVHSSRGSTCAVQPEVHPHCPTPPLVQPGARCSKTSGLLTWQLAQQAQQGPPSTAPPSWIPLCWWYCRTVQPGFWNPIPSQVTWIPSSTPWTRHPLWGALVDVDARVGAWLAPCSTCAHACARTGGSACSICIIQLCAVSHSSDVQTRVALFLTVPMPSSLE